VDRSIFVHPVGTIFQHVACTLNRATVGASGLLSGSRVSVGWDQCYSRGRGKMSIRKTPQHVFALATATGVKPALQM